MQLNVGTANFKRIDLGFEPSPEKINPGFVSE